MSIPFHPPPLSLLYVRVPPGPDLELDAPGNLEASATNFVFQKLPEVMEHPWSRRGALALPRGEGQAVLQGNELLDLGFEE